MSCFEKNVYRDLHTAILYSSVVFGTAIATSLKMFEKQLYGYIMVYSCCRILLYYYTQDKRNTVREEIRTMNEKLSALERMMEIALTQPGSKFEMKPLISEGQHRQDSICSDE